ncbi:hypothetical protein FFT09_02435 [Saccharomonospora piscinae]|uniref:hypothetical protein n=1 Tax=Saccharomonospora piscinae TaxID=687388 RepID=UPI00110756A3|nr:hypothetical protein [Saccharomonospora piscinae]TLW94753.1 hypothetical protein FFT09_02435 [Saccharomonospora piscinae]
MRDVILPSEQDFIDFLGVSPILLEGGEATYLLEFSHLVRSSRISFDAIERSVVIKVFGQDQRIFDVYAEGLDRISLFGDRETKEIEFFLSGPCYRLSIRLFVRPEVHLECLHFIA